MVKKNNISLKLLLWPHYWPIACLFGLFWLLTWLPYRFLLLLGNGIGKISFFFAKNMRHYATVNLRLCFPELTSEQHQRLLKNNFSSFGIGFIEAALGWFGSKKRLNTLGKIHGIENMAAALKAGHGAMLIGSHFFPLEIAGRLCSQHFPIGVMYRKHKKSWINTLLVLSRYRHYHRMVERSDIRGMIRALKDNTVIWYTPDVDAGERNSIFIPFFGIPAATITSTVRYAQITGAKVLPASFYRRDDGTGYDVYIGPALENFPSGNLETDLLFINQMIENFIRNKPEQYMWQYRRFKTQPDRSKRFYD